MTGLLICPRRHNVYHEYDKPDPGRLNMVTSVVSGLTLYLVGCCASCQLQTRILFRKVKIFPCGSIRRCTTSTIKFSASIARRLNASLLLGYNSRYHRNMFHLFQRQQVHPKGGFQLVIPTSLPGGTGTRNLSPENVNSRSATGRLYYTM